MDQGEGKSVFFAQTMKELFSCRNCVHNAPQGINIGSGKGFCLKFNSVIENPVRTTCKYLHRKDLPNFLVDEGIREHAAEFAGCPRIADLKTRRRIKDVSYNERRDWEIGSFDSIFNSVAQYHRATGDNDDESHEVPSGFKWRFMQTYAASFEGRKALVHASLIRRYMAKCDSWVSSWRLFMALIEDLDHEIIWDERHLVGLDKSGSNLEEIREEALWELVFCRLSALQEFGFHASIEELHWVTDTLNGALSDFDWPRLQKELGNLKPRWHKQIISLAKKSNVFFADRGSS